jgi:predicted nucleic acid-binding Zn ribbon protein
MMARSLPDPARNRGDEPMRRQRARNRAVLLVLLGLVALIYVISIVRMGGG